MSTRGSFGIALDVLEQAPVNGMNQPIGPQTPVAQWPYLDFIPGRASQAGVDGTLRRRWHAPCPSKQRSKGRARSRGSRAKRSPRRDCQGELCAPCARKKKAHGIEDNAESKVDECELHEVLDEHQAPTDPLVLTPLHGSSTNGDGQELHGASLEHTPKVTALTLLSSMAAIPLSERGKRLEFAAAGSGFTARSSAKALFLHKNSWQSGLPQAPITHGFP